MTGAVGERIAGVSFGKPGNSLQYHVLTKQR